MTRLMEIKILVPEGQVGGILADLEGRATSFHVGVVQEVPFGKNKPKAQAKRKYAKRQKVKKVRKKATVKTPAAKAKTEKLRALVIAQLHDGDMPFKAIREFGKQAGYRFSSVRATVANLVSHNTIKKKANGDYTFTGVRG